MRAYVLPASPRPPPWGDRPADWPVLLRPAGDWLREALRCADLDVVDGAPPPGLMPASELPALFVRDDVLLTAEFVKAFLSGAADRAGRSLAKEPWLGAALGPSDSARRQHGRAMLPSLPDGSQRIPLILHRNPASAPPETEADLLRCATDCEPVLVDPRERSRDVPVPRAWADDAARGTLRFAAARAIALHLSHRTLLLQANLDLLGATFLRALDRPKWWIALRFLLDKLRPGARVLLSRRGRGCRIHRTAIVEGCRLGDGCEIGAFAVLRGAVLGDGVVVEDAAQVHLSVLGAHSRVSRQTSLFACVLMEGAHSAQAVMQASVLGRDAVTTSASWFMDVRFGPDLRSAPIRVEARDGTTEHGLLETGSKVLGCDVGHGTVVGAGVLVAPGRMLPSRALVVADAAGIVTKLAGEIDPMDAGGRTLRVREGVLLGTD